MTPEERAIYERAYKEYWDDPLGILESRELWAAPNYPIEPAICEALAQGGWEVHPGDGVGIVANMIRAAVQAERLRCAGIARAAALDCKDKARSAQYSENYAQETANEVCLEIADAIERE